MGTFNVQLPDGTVVNDIPKGTTKAELFGKIHSSNPDLFKRNMAVEPTLQNYIPTEDLEKEAASSVPEVMGAGGVIGTALKGLGSSIVGALSVPFENPIASSVGMSTDIATKVGMGESPTRAILGTVPGASGVLSAADLTGRALGLKPLVQESIPEAQESTAEGAGQLGAMYALGKATPRILRGVSPEAQAAAGTERIKTALVPKVGRAGAAGAQMEADLQTAQPHLAKIGREGELSSTSLMDKLHGRGTPEWFNDTAQNIADYKAKLWKDNHAAAIDRHAQAPFDWQKVAGSAEREILPQDDTVQSRMARSWIEREIPKLETLSDADTKIRLLNADIRALPEKYGPVGVRVRQAALSALRNQIDNQLESMGEPGVKQSNRAYGALKNIQDRLQERYYQETGKAARSSPIPDWMHAYVFGHSGGAAIGVGARLGSMFKPSPAMNLFKGLQTLGRSDLEPAAPYTPPFRPIRGLLGQGPLITPAPADTSFVTGGKAMPPIYTGSRMLPEGNPPIIVGRSPLGSAVRGMPTEPELYQSTRAMRTGKLLPETAGGPYAMPPSSTVEVLPPAERVPGRYAGLLDQRVERIGPKGAEPEVNARKPIKIKGRRIYLPLVEEEFGKK